LPPEILSIAVLSPALEGTPLRVETRGLEASLPTLLRLAIPGTTGSVLLDEAASESVGSTRQFPLNRISIEYLGLGEVTVDATIVQGTMSSLPVPLSLTVASDLSLILTEVQSGDVYRESPILIRGNGLINRSEGSIVANVTGNFTPLGESETAVTAQFDVEPITQDDRTRASFRITTALGGLRSGQFNGVVQLVSTLKNGNQQTSGVEGVAFNILPPSILQVPSAPLYLGQIVPVTGLGFLGAPDAPGEATLLQFSGTIATSTDIISLDATEVVAEFVDGGQVRIPLDFRVQDEELVSNMFGVQSGAFSGTLTPVLVAGLETETGQPFEASLKLAGVRQVTVIRFLPGFFASLGAYGLALARDQVIDGIMERLRDLYAGINVVFYLETSPNDVIPLAISTLEIGGSDPNGLGAFGYDNTPGKDVGNLRLNDRIGGANAITQQDGSPGYGGVFIESYLWWSESTPPPGFRPSGAPNPDPLFDNVFGPLRAEPATLNELNGIGESTRIAQVERAVRSLSYLVAETAAHELGHSLGLAAPYGSKTVFHNQTPGDGCLMDTGIERPLGERIGEPGFSTTQFCGDNLDYLQSILALTH
jgi:hypothetical protein